MDIKGNEAITCVFGSYGSRVDEKKQVTHVWLEGLGVEVIEDFVEELIWFFIRWVFLFIDGFWWLLNLLLEYNSFVRVNLVGNMMFLR